MVNSQDVLSNELPKCCNTTSPLLIQLIPQLTIHDHVDCSLPMLQRMFNKREKIYKTMGYTIRFAGESASFHVAKQIEAVLL